MVVGDPQIAQDILTSPHCVNKSFIYNALDDGTGRGLFSLPSKYWNNIASSRIFLNFFDQYFVDPKWNLHRRLLNPAFGHKVLLNLLPIFNEEVNKLIKTFEMFLKKDVDLTKVFQNFTLKIAARKYKSVFN